MKSRFVVHVIDDNRLLRESLCLTLASAGHSCCAHRFAKDLVECERLHEPGCAIVDLHLGEGSLSGLDLLHQLVDASRPFPVIAITGDTRITTAVMAYGRGAFELLIKPFATESLFSVVASALRSIENPQEHAEEIGRLRQLFGLLDSREREVLELLLDGRSRDEIGKILALEASVVERARQSIMAKTQAATLFALARMRSRTKSSG